MKVRVNAKVNLTLDVTGEYGNGYHNLDTIMTSIGIFDVIECEKSEKICVIMDGKECDESNTAYKVASICHNEYAVPPISVKIEKGIPFGGGLGGSSADASATLFCIKKMFNLSDNAVFEIAKRVGSDVNFILQGGMCRAGGKGDNIEQLPFKEYSFVVAKGKQSCLTKDVFNKFDKIGESTAYTKNFVNALISGDNELKYVGNCLQKPSVALCPEIKGIVSCLKKYSNYVCMSGSGACVFAVLDNMNDANNLADMLKNRFSYVKACTSLPYGIKEF